MRILLTLILTALILCCAAGPVSAQLAFERPDSINARLDRKLRRGPDTEFRVTQIIAPAALLSAGVIIHCFAHDSFDNYMRDRALSWRGTAPKAIIDDYAQYAPFIFAVGLGTLGVEAEHGLAERAIVCGLSAISIAAVTRTMKTLIDSPRPDASDAMSFPSGHTGIAFTGAEFVRMEYGWGWGICAYALAAGVGVLRLHDDKHWCSDVIAGAGTGIFCAHIGEWMLNPVKRLFRMDVSVLPSVDPVYGSGGINLAIKF